MRRSPATGRSAGCRVRRRACAACAGSCPAGRSCSRTVAAASASTRRPEEPAPELEPTLEEAVRLHRSDVPLAVLLSGGLDSSLIAALAAAELDEPLRTFSVGFADAEYDERGPAGSWRRRSAAATRSSSSRRRSPTTSRRSRRRSSSRSRTLRRSRSGTSAAPTMKPDSRSTRRCWETAGCEMPNSCWIAWPISPGGGSSSASSSRMRRRTGSPRMSSACMSLLLRGYLYKSRVMTPIGPSEATHRIRNRRARRAPHPLSAPSPQRKPQCAARNASSASLTSSAWVHSMPCGAPSIST